MVGRGAAVFSTRKANGLVAAFPDCRRLVEKDDWDAGSFPRVQKERLRQLAGAVREDGASQGVSPSGEKLSGSTDHSSVQWKQRGYARRESDERVRGFEFADGLDVSPRFDAHGAGRLWRENIDNCRRTETAKLSGISTHSVAW